MTLFWVLTTYTTLCNYQHSLQRIRFSAVVFDEIQTLKNHASLRAKSGRSVNADFRIGLTGTPIESHVPMAIHGGDREHSFDCLLQSLMQRKRNLALAALWPMGDTSNDTGELQRILLSGEMKTGGDPLCSAIGAMFERDRFPQPVFGPDGSVEIQ